MKKRNNIFEILATLLTVTILFASIPLEAMATNGAFALPGMTGDQAYDVARIAASQIGYNSGTNKDNIYAKDVGGLNYRDWCAYFVTWCVKKSGLSASKYPSSSEYGRVTLIQKWFNERGRWHRKNATYWTYDNITDNSSVDREYVPKAGDLIILETNSKLGDGPDHIGIVESVSNGTVTYIHGNSRNSAQQYVVKRSSYALSNSNIWGYCSPDYEAKNQTKMTGYNMSVNQKQLRSTSLLYVNVTPYQGTATKIKLYFENESGQVYSTLEFGSSINQALIGIPAGKTYLYAEIIDAYGSFKGSRNNGAIVLYSSEMKWGTPSNFGSSFSAYIQNIYCGTVVTNDNVNVTGRTLTYADNQLWKFEKLSDGSYKIISLKDNKCLTVVSSDSYYDGINVNVSSYNGSDNQKWYLYADGNGGYFLNPKCSSQTVLDLDGPHKKDGTNIQIWSKSEGIGAAQDFKIVKYTPHTTCTWNSGKITKAATCTTNGIKTYTCTVCGKTKTTSIAATGHKGGTATCQTKAKCSTCGTSYGSYRSHDYSTNWTIDKQATCTTEGSKSHHCKNCNVKKDVTVIATTGHKGGTATCSAKAKCSICGASYGSYKSHDYSTSWTIDKQATCTTAGSKSHHCKNCNAKKDATAIAVTGHKGGTATCLAKAKCSTCGTSYGNYGSHAYNTSWTIDKQATCTTEGSKSHHCKNCSVKKDITVINATGHKGENGKCDVCGVNYGSCEKHEYSTLWTIDKQPTCTAEGSKSHHCKKCDAKADITVMAASGHQGGIATCEAQAICEVCGVSYGGYSSHQYSVQWTIDKASTCTKKGSKSRHCMFCGDTTDETDIPKTAHNYVDGICTVCEDERLPEVGEKYQKSGVLYVITESTEKRSTVKVEAIVNNKKTTVKIPNTVEIEGIDFKVTAIGKGAFQGMQKLKKVTIGKNVVTIERNAFKDCSKLKNIVIQSTKLKKVGENAFQDIYEKAKIKVPKKKAKTYKKMLKNKGQGAKVRIYA